MACYNLDGGARMDYIKANGNYVEVSGSVHGEFSLCSRRIGDETGDEGVQRTGEQEIDL